MKRVLFIFLCFTFLSAFGFEDMPVFPQNTGINIERVDDQQSLLDTDKMKKTDIVNKARETAQRNSKTRFRFDEQQIMYQKALDYTTGVNNSTFMPRF